jgi:hypothetical protein
LVAWLTSAAALFKVVCAFLLLSCKSDLFGFSVRQKAKSGSHPAASCLLLAKQPAAPSSQQQLLWPTLFIAGPSLLFSEIVALMREEPRPPRRLFLFFFVGKNFSPQKQI